MENEVPVKTPTIQLKALVGFKIGLLELSNQLWMSKQNFVKTFYRYLNITDTSSIASVCRRNNFMKFYIYSISNYYHYEKKINFVSNILQVTM